ncbi:MAG: transcriptional repressor [Nitrospirae bacterium]|nr:transcriptional repressor [Nitrospirota bacterium]
MPEQYRQLGMKLTPQRLAILHYLSGNGTHPSAENIYKDVLKQFPTMSFATVYNTLDALAEKGGLKVVTVDPDKKRYDPNTGPHHHLYCIKCKNIVDINKEFKIRLSDEMRRDFDVLAVCIEFHGICRKCKK